MKPVLVLLISLFSTGLFAQSGTPKTSSSGSCFKDWYGLFRERGAKPVEDGTQDVIITLRNGDYAECFMGKIDVAGGKIVSKLSIQKVDGTYEEFDKKVSDAYQNSEGTLKEEMRMISNGMSAPVVLADGASIRLFFYKFLGDKPKANKKAPAPSVLVK
ncbi:MAG TPA: hypothetical protein VFW11_02895 [Cyclobacteriaceae bacterium]|nr:hypothetical protein [Cyclobacteriaceae bacterium]